MKKYSFYWIISILLISNTVFAGESNFPPSLGYVPDETTAIKIAEVILIPIYGKQKIQKEKPFSARLENDVWIVTGHLPKGWLGGIAKVELSKKDAQIISVSHGK